MFTKEIENRINIIDAEIARHTAALSELNMERTKLLIGIEVIKDYETKIDLTKETEPKKDIGIQQSSFVKKRTYHKKQNTNNTEISANTTPVSPNHDMPIIINDTPTKRKAGLTQTIVKLLDTTKHGLSSQILLEKVNKAVGKEIDHKSFYPTLSRLFKENRIIRSAHTKKWKLVKSI